MSLDSSLKTGGGLQNHRSVLTRAERVAKLAAQKKVDMEKGKVLGIPKVANRSIKTG